MKWRHQEEAKSTIDDSKDNLLHRVTCTTSAYDVTNDAVVAEKSAAATGTGSERGAPTPSNIRKPASIMSVADILDLRVTALQ